ncbi:GNAT family N-acetyltransferase [Roseiarcus sp.]|uniref:GNAT family N-acetyltransferase n=1 Tax=Roseiarcus sp. TaxID=1969460 RepID=UPI003C407FBF
MTAQDSPHASVAPIAPEHIESFHRAVDTVARERKFLTLLEALPLSQTREFVLNNIKSGNPQFVALAAGEVVGWCDVRRHFFPAHAHRGTLGMGIVPAYRGRGLGARLLNATLEAAFDAGFVRVELNVHADNGRAIALYDRVGFVREGTQRDAVFVDGEYRDAIAMALVRRAKVWHP